MTNEFFHGVQGFITRVEGRPVQAIRSSVIGVVVTAGKGPVNTPTLIFGNITEGYNKFGPFLGDGFTAGMALKGIFDQIGTLAVVVNVCDPQTHNSDIVGEKVTLSRVTGKGNTAKRYYVGDISLENTIVAPVKLGTDAKWDVPAGITITGVSATKGGAALVDGTADGNYNVTAGKLTVVGATLTANAGKTYYITYTVAGLVEGTDYTVDSDLGQLTRLNTSSILLPEAELTVDYTYVDPTKVTPLDIVGTPAAGATPAKGIYALRAAPTTPGILVKPRILIAPGFSDQLVVGNALDSASRVLNGRDFLDAPNDSPEAAVAYKNNFEGELNRSSVHYPNYYVDHPTISGALLEVPASIYLAGAQARVDKYDGKGNPHVSLSNKQIIGIAGLSRPVDHTVINLGETDGESTQQWLNSQNVMTTIREDGWRAYGNTQANGEFICVQRMADFVIESAALALVWAVDKNINGPALLDQILTVVRHFLRALEAQGALVANPDPENDNDVWFPAELNTPDQTAQGIAFLNFRMNPPPPLQRLTVTGELTHDFVKRLFTEV